MAKQLLRLVHYVVSAVFMLIFAVVITLAIATKVVGTPVDIFGYQLKSVLSGSMEPGMKTGSVIAIKTAGADKSFQKGDVITFQTSDHMLVTHRIYQVLQEGKLYKTKGDANDAPDMEPVLAENIVGSYTGWTIPYVGYVLQFANSKNGAAILMILPGLMFAGFGFVSIWQAFRQTEKNDMSPRTKAQAPD